MALLVFIVLSLNPSFFYMKTLDLYCIFRASRIFKNFEKVFFLTKSHVTDQIRDTCEVLSYKERVCCLSGMGEC